MNRSWSSCGSPTNDACPLTVLVAQIPSTTPEVNTATRRLKINRMRRGISSGRPSTQFSTSLVDAKKNKPNDPSVRTLSGEMKARTESTSPKGSKLIGHITEAKPKAKGRPELAAWDRVRQGGPQGGANSSGARCQFGGLFKPQPALMESDGMPAGPGVPTRIGWAAGPTSGPGAPGSSPGPGGRATTGVTQTDNYTVQTPPVDGRQRSTGRKLPFPAFRSNLSRAN